MPRQPLPTVQSRECSGPETGDNNEYHNAMPHQPLPTVQLREWSEPETGDNSAYYNSTSHHPFPIPMIYTTHSAPPPHISHYYVHPYNLRPGVDHPFWLPYQ
uniref:Uncharacterized protein n=1 Tax=Schizaphis graminum TaxID=13262 RepID=A0A2S2P9H7_SCHGA